MFRPRQPHTRPFTPLALSAVEVSFEGALPISAPSLLSLFSLFATKRTKLTPLFSYSSPLFKKECLPKPFAINLFRTLSQNTRGGGPPSPLSFHPDRPTLIHLLERCATVLPLSVGCQLSAVSSLSLSPFAATLTDSPQLIENPATLSPAFATLTSRVNPNPFVCHSYKKHPGWGYPRRASRLFVFSPFNIKLLALSTLSLEGSLVEGSTASPGLLYVYPLH